MINGINNSAIEKKKIIRYVCRMNVCMRATRGSGQLPERLMYIRNPLFLCSGEHVSRNVDYRSVASAFGGDNIG